MKNILDWSRPRTWVLVGLLIALAGAVIMSATESEGGPGQLLGVAGVLLMVIGFAAYLVTQVRKAIEASTGQ